MKWKIKFMFETTNQIYVLVSFYIYLDILDIEMVYWIYVPNHQPEFDVQCEHLVALVGSQDLPLSQVFSLAW